MLFERLHKDAQPEFQLLAKRVHTALSQAGEPSRLSNGEWHLPFVGGNEKYSHLSIEDRCRVSAMKCARISYNNHFKDTTIEDDLEKFARLVAGNDTDPGHWSPLEHVAKAQPGCLNSNLRGWFQLRKEYQYENVQLIPFSSREDV
jgi:thymidylate synthase ThyX